MNTELKQAAQQAVDAFHAFGDADDFASLFELTKKMCALRTAIQQAEAKQPATGEPIKLHKECATMPNDERCDECQQPATPEPVQADSSEHLRVVASLGDALRRLSFAAQTTGGTDGPDAELQSAIGQAEQALSLGGIWQAMSATTEPVKVAPYNPTEEMRWAMKRIDPALSSEQCRALWSAAWSAAPSTRPAPSVPDSYEKAISSGHFGVLPVKATIPMCKAGWGASGGELTFQQIGHIYEEMYKARPLPDAAMIAAKDAT